MNIKLKLSEKYLGIEYIYKVNSLILGFYWILVYEYYNKYYHNRLTNVALSSRILKILECG